MDVTLSAHNVAIAERFRDYVAEKSDKVVALAERAQTFHVKVSREISSRGPSSEDVVALTVRGKGPVIRAEAKAADKDIRAYFVAIAPEHDQQRVYTSDIRKMIKWFKSLDEVGMFKEEKKEESVKKDKPKKEKVAKPKKAKATKKESKPKKK